MMVLTRDGVRAAEKEIAGGGQEERLAALRRFVESHEDMRAAVEHAADVKRAADQEIDRLKLALGKVTAERDGARIDGAVAGSNGAFEKLTHAGFIIGVGLCRMMLEASVVLAEGEEAKVLKSAGEALALVEWPGAKVVGVRKRGGS